MSIQCLKCGYSITEPICASCVIDEIKVWLHEQNVKRHIAKKINNRLKHLLNDIESKDYAVLPSRNIWKVSIMECIRCKKEMHLMCFYCVINQAYQIAKNNLRNTSSIGNFHEYFNTDIQQSFNTNLHEYFNTHLCSYN